MRGVRVFITNTRRDDILRCEQIACGDVPGVGTAGVHSEVCGATNLLVPTLSTLDIVGPFTG